MGNTSVKPHPRNRNRKQVHWKAADRPSPPGKPQLVSETDITPDVVTIRWDPPRYDGGSPITGYLVEHRRYGSPHWVRATPLLVRFTQLSLSGLEPGWRYQFRVSAENAVGLSIPGELSELLTVTLQRSAVTVPRFVDELSDAVALENEKVEFVAQFLGQPAPKICWFKDGFEIFSSRRIRILTENDKSILTIHQSSLSDEGEIKCTATNKAGHASTKAKLTLEALPSIRLPRQYEEGLLFELGEVVRLKVSIAGRPSPLVFWTHNNDSIKSNDRYEIECTDKYSSVRIQQVERTDRGEYQIKAVNKLGEANASFLVTVTDKPEPPGQARVVMTLGRSVTLSWTTPSDDGGCKIGNYIVEYFRIGWDVWLKAATCRQLTTTVGDLIEGSEYKFRIKAESPYGISEPSEESDTIFIPDHKRGILSPSIRSKSQPREIDVTEHRHKKNSKTKPRSVSTTRAESRRPITPVHFYEGGVPIRPARAKVKSPSITPELSPVVTRRTTTTPEIMNKSIFDGSSMARDLAYGSPEIKLQKPEFEIIPNDLPYNSAKLDQLSNSVVKSTINVIQHQDAKSRNLDFKHSADPEDANASFELGTRRSSDNNGHVEKFANTKNAETREETNPANPFSSTLKKIHQKRETLSPNISPKFSKKQSNVQEVSRDKSPTPLRSSRSRSPSPRNSTKIIHPLNMFKDKSDHLSNSSEFMLVLLPDGHEGKGIEYDIDFDFNENCVPPPISLSAPELGAEELLFEPLRMSVSSTELLHVHTMSRFYEAMVSEEAEINAKKRKISMDVPKIQINSKDEPIINLERRNSLRRRLSGGLVVPSHLSWNERRHSLKNTPDIAEIPENNLRRFPIIFGNKSIEKEVSDLKDASNDSLGKNAASIDKKRELFAKRQRSESEEREEEEFQKIREKMSNQKSEQKKTVEVVQEEEWDEVAEDEDQEYEESISESESESSEKLSDNFDPLTFEIDQEEKTYASMQDRKLKKKEYSDEPFEILTKPNPLPDPNFIPKPILKRRSIEDIPEKPIRKSVDTNKLLQHSLSVQPQATNAKEATRDLENSRQRSFSLFPQALSSKQKREVPTMRKRGNSPPIPFRKLSAAAEISGMTAASVGLPQPAKPPVIPPMIKKKTEDEIRVVVDHYGDIVKSYGQRSRSVPKVYLNTEDLKEAARRQSDEYLKDVDKSDEDDSEEDKELEEQVLYTGNRRRSFIEASSALFKTVKESVTAALAGDQDEDDTIPPDADISPSMQRRGSNQIIKRRSSKPLNKLELPKASKKSTKSPLRGENWSNLRTPSPGPQGRKSPTPMRRTSLVAPASQARRSSLTSISPTLSVKPKVRENTTQTSHFKSDVLLAAQQEELTAKAELKVRTTVDYLTDLAMFIVACWLYLFQNELLAIPVLIVMVYRQINEEIRKKLPGWMTGKKKVKRK